MDNLVQLQRDRISELEERVRQLEGSLFGGVDVPVEWRLTPAEARVFATLLKKTLTTKDQVMMALYSDRVEQPLEKIVDVFICKMRKKLVPYGIIIETVWGRGYALADREKHKARFETAH